MGWRWGVGRLYAVIQRPGLMKALSSTCLPKSPWALTSSWSMDEDGTWKIMWEVSTGQDQKWHKALLPTNSCTGSKGSSYGLRKQRKQVMVSTYYSWALFNTLVVKDPFHLSSTSTANFSLPNGDNPKSHIIISSPGPQGVQTPLD